MKTETNKILYKVTIGDILNEFIEENELTQNQLAKYIGVPSNRINEIVRGRRNITTDTDLRLCKFFEKSEGFFTRMQDSIESKNQKILLEKELEKIPTYSNALKEIKTKKIKAC